MISMILEKLSDLAVKMIYRVGSTSWSSDNWHDIDVVAVVEEPVGFHIRCIRELNLEVFVYPEKQFQSLIVGNGTASLNWYFGLATVHTENLLYGHPIESYDWFEYQYKTLLHAYDRGIHTYLNTDILAERKIQYCSKTMTLALLIYYTILNRSFTITDEQRAIVQRCHDKQLPLLYAVELRENMKKILQEKNIL